MADYIDRDELLRHYDEYYCKPCREKGDDYNGVRCRACGTGDAIDTAENISAADVRENVRGEWLNYYGEKMPLNKKGKTTGASFCSACKVFLTASDEYECCGNFCSNCGADMRGEEK